MCISKKIVSGIMMITMLILIITSNAVHANAYATDIPTGVGLSAHAMKAYTERWQYVWGGTEYGKVDCSGLFVTYKGVGGNRVNLCGVASVKGSVSDGIPNIHGLGLYQPGHVGIYVGSNAAIDARCQELGVVYQNAYTKGWTQWFKVVGVTYPSDGWVRFNHQSFWYENGEYVLDTSRRIKGIVYNFNQFGYSDIAPPENEYVMTDGTACETGQINKPAETSEPAETSKEPKKTESNKKTNNTTKKKTQNKTNQKSENKKNLSPTQKNERFDKYMTLITESHTPLFLSECSKALYIVLQNHGSVYLCV